MAGYYIDFTNMPPIWPYVPEYPLRFVNNSGVAVSLTFDGGSSSKRWGKQ